MTLVESENPEVSTGCGKNISLRFSAYIFNMHTTMWLNISILVSCSVFTVHDKSRRYICLELFF